MEDSRFKDVPNLKKSQVPHQLHWFIKEDSFTDEMLGLAFKEIENLIRISHEAYTIFERATDKVLKDRHLNLFDIPPFFERCIYHSWENRTRHQFFAGRFDINGGIDGLPAKIIEFNADTFSTLPETLLWQKLQLQQVSSQLTDFNLLEKHLTNILSKIASRYTDYKPVLLGSSLGYEEDVLNVNTVLDLAYKSGFQVAYQDLETVTFSPDGIFYELGDEFVPVDVWYKLIPWDWIVYEEPSLGRLLSQIIIEDKAIVLNPAYTLLWQNKKFLTYITQHFPNNVIAETYLTNSLGSSSYVQKPFFGRLGENIVVRDDRGKETQSKGDYGSQPVVYQKYYPLNIDSDQYYYQFGIFYTNQPGALNIRAQDKPIMTDDCTFMSHYVL